MIRGSFFGLEIGKTGLTTAQFGLDVTGHNIANLDTAGYTRQRIVSTAYDPFSTIGRFAPVGQGLVGGGVRVQILDQIRSAYLDRRFRTESGLHSYWETRSQSLSYIESFFDNVNEKTSINHSLSQFFESMTEIAKDPVSGAPRTLMQTTAMDLVQQLNMMYEGLVDFQKVENRAVETKVGDINRMAKEIAALNVAIYTFEITGMIANDLRDKRNLMIDELSNYIDIEYEEYPDPLSKDMIGIKHNLMKITVAGQTLIDHDYPRSHDPDMLGIAYVYGDISGEPTAIPYWRNIVDINALVDNRDVLNGEMDPGSAEYTDHLNALFGAGSGSIWERWNSAGTNTGVLNLQRLEGGELLSHIHMRDGIGGGVDSRNKGVPYYIEMINDLARALVVEINKQHLQGWSDHPERSETGILFFDIFDEDGNSILMNYVEMYDADDNLITDPEDKNIAYVTFNLPDDVLRQITAQNITLSEAVQQSGYNIAAAASKINRAGEGDDPDELQRGNNENIREIYKLFSNTNITVFDKPIGSFDEYATTIRFDVGKTLNTSKQAMETCRVLTLSANNQRTAVAGVSLDEEMVGLVRYNHAFNGAARVITQMDDALDRLINGTGRVGL